MKLMPEFPEKTGKGMA